MIHAGESMRKAASREFESDAIDVLGDLRGAITDVVSSLGVVRKPADLQKTLRLDQTLCWQVFQIASPALNDGSTLGIGAKMPSRSALKRFLAAAETKGVSAEKSERVWSNFDRFEHLVQTHAGDRTSFISMVSAAAGRDADTVAADAQHHRNVYRAMSHIVGMQAIAKYNCCVLDRRSANGYTFDMAYLVGYVGLRLLRAVPSVKVFCSRVTSINDHPITREGLGGDPALGGGFLMPAFSSQPVPDLRTKDAQDGWQVTELHGAMVGNRGACTLHFGTRLRSEATPEATQGEPNTFASEVSIDKPLEVVFHDILVRPGALGDWVPTVEVLLGNAADATRPRDVISVPGDHRMELLGKGPDKLATPDIPDYPAVLRAAARQMGWDIEQFEAWRLRVEFPIYQSTIHERWLPPKSTR